MDINTLILEAVQLKSPIYHYLFDDESLNKILANKRLLPISTLILPNQIDDYSKRAISKKLPGITNDKINNANIYWEYMYNQFYRSILNQNYTGNYGIYLTPIDLFAFPNDLKYRICYTIDDLSKSTIIQVGKSYIKKLNSDTDIKLVMSKFQDPKHIEQLYKTSKLVFIKLPQIVTFSDYLPVTKSRIEKRGN